jgi:hypothetical protein
MTAKADFTEEEWRVVLEGPPSAGMIVITASKGGMFKETWEMAKAYTDARQHHRQSELLDEIVAAKPKMDHTRYHSQDELKQASLGHIRDAVALLASKGTEQEVSEYSQFVLTLADKVAHAHREDGVDVSDGERAAMAEITEALGAPS